MCHLSAHFGSQDFLLDKQNMKLARHLIMHFIKTVPTQTIRITNQLDKRDVIVYNINFLFIYCFINNIAYIMIVKHLWMVDLWCRKMLLIIISP